MADWTRTCLSNSDEGAFGSTFGVVAIGSEVTNVGSSQPCDRPTRRCAHPNLQTISVAADRSDRTLGGDGDISAAVIV